MTNSLAELRDSWLIIAIGLVALVSAFSAPTFALPFVFVPVIEEYGWTREQATLLASYKFIAGAIAAVPIGKLIDIVGARAVLIAASLLGACAMLSFLLIEDLWFYYGAGICLGVAAAGVVVGVQVLIARSIHRNQGMAIGIAMVGASAGGILIPPVVGGLIELYNWRVAVAALSLGIWLITLPLLVFALKKDSGKGFVQGAGTGAKARDSGGGLSAGSFFTERRFWLISCGLLIVAMVDQGITQHTVLYLNLDVGIRPGLVVAAMSLFSVFGIVGKVMFGWVYDRISVTGIALVYFLLALSAILALPVAGVMTMLFFVFVRGVAHGGLVIDVPVISKHCYGPADLGRTIGIYTAILQLGFALGPWLMGRMHDSNGSYDQAFVLFAALSVVAGFCLLRVTPDYWRSRIRSGEPESTESVTFERQYYT